MTSNNPSDATVSEAMLRAGKHAYLQASFSAIPEADKTLKAIYLAMTSAREQPVGDEGLRCDRCAVLEDLLETATSERDKARDESRKADDETLALKVRNISQIASDMAGSYAAIKAFQRRALKAEAALAEALATSPTPDSKEPTHGRS